MPATALLLGAVAVASGVNQAGYRLIWSDEFNSGTGPDVKKWEFEEGMPRNNEGQFYTKDRRENIRIVDGKLVIEARMERFRNADITSASISTRNRFSFLYGKVEARARVPEGRGTWPAIWLLAEDWPINRMKRSAEIDIMEHVGHNPGTIHGTTHMGKHGDEGLLSRGGKVLAPKATQAFHVYGVEWSPDRIVFTLDGSPYYEVKYRDATTWAFDRRMILKLNLAIGGTWGGQEGIDTAALPQKFEIDYVRVYQIPGQGVSGTSTVAGR